MLIADYWIVRKRELRLEDLYLADGIYRGWKWPAILATVVGCALAWSGLVISSLRPLYDYAWFVGFFTSGIVYIALRPTDAPAIARPSSRSLEGIASRSL